MAGVPLGVERKRLWKGADTAMVTLSRVLGAPSGSLLLAPGDLMEPARRVRKQLGGGMRQVGILAAAGLVALETMIARLAEDHAHARLLAERLCEIPGFVIDPAGVETNIVIFQTVRLTASEVVERFKADGILCLAVEADRVRMVTHLDVGRKEILQAAEAARRLAES